MLLLIDIFQTPCQQTYLPETELKSGDSSPAVAFDRANNNNMSRSTRWCSSFLVRPPNIGAGLARFVHVGEQFVQKASRAPQSPSKNQSLPPNAIGCHSFLIHRARIRFAPVCTANLVLELNLGSYAPPSGRTSRLFHEANCENARPLTD